jgi:molybdenum cofactor cytidylyltransferase
MNLVIASTRMENSIETNKVGAVILGAGMSRRMGQPKLLLPWGKITVIETILHTLEQAGLETIVLVTGASHAELAVQLNQKQVTLAYNPDFADGNMVHSLDVGLRALQTLGYSSALLALGDQPQMQVSTVIRVLQAGWERPDQLILPSYNMKRGHPWMIPSSLWASIFELPADKTMRDFINSQAEHLKYQLVDTPTIFADLDTPEEYQREKPAC